MSLQREQEVSYFQNALSDFTFEVAGGGAIRHLTDLGYTAEQIMQELSFPLSRKKVEKAMWEHMVDRGIILCQEPGCGNRHEKAEYVKEYDRYGKVSFRRVVRERREDGVIRWKERYYDRERDGELSAFLERKCEGKAWEKAYASCDFGVRKSSLGDLQEELQALDGRQREYIMGLPWENRIVFHRLDGRMREIIVRLHAENQYTGSLYFMDTEEKILLGGQKT